MFCLVAVSLGETRDGQTSSGIPGFYSTNSAADLHGNDLFRPSCHREMRPSCSQLLFLLGMRGWGGGELLFVSVFRFC